MTVIFAKAPGKIILFGEHAVVYGQPAMAIPVTRVNATARVLPKIQAEPGLVRLQAPDIQLDADLTECPEDHPLAAAIRLTLEALAPDDIPSFTLQVSSTIPIASGMGSSAAISVAIIRALADFLGGPLPDAEVSRLAYEVERIQHGTPSGIDNNVIAHQQPVVFQQGQPLVFLKIKRPTHWIIADTGESTPTRETIAAVRELHAHNPEKFEAIFQEIGTFTRKAEAALTTGDLALLGSLMNLNQMLLERLTVSSPQLKKLIQTALKSGAAGAKLSGGGRGGNMIALARPDQVDAIQSELLQAGAVRVITTLLPGNGER